MRTFLKWFITFLAINFCMRYNKSHHVNGANRLPCYFDFILFVSFGVCNIHMYEYFYWCDQSAKTLRKWSHFVVEVIVIRQTLYKWYWAYGLVFPFDVGKILFHGGNCFLSFVFLNYFLLVGLLSFKTYSS